MACSRAPVSAFLETVKLSGLNQVYPAGEDGRIPPPLGAILLDHFPAVLSSAVPPGRAVPWMGTAVVVHANSLEVIGGPLARATITDGQLHDGKPYYFLKGGDRFDLARRLVIASPGN